MRDAYVPPEIVEVRKRWHEEDARLRAKAKAAAITPAAATMPAEQQLAWDRWADDKITRHVNDLVREINKNYTTIGAEIAALHKLLQVDKPTPQNKAINDDVKALVEVVAALSDEVDALRERMDNLEGQIN